MIWDILKNDWLLMTLTVLAVIGVAVRLHVFHSYRRLVKESTRPASSKHSLMKMLYNKFTACYQLKIGIGNVDSFVDRHIKSFKTGGFYLLTWEQFAKVPAVASVITVVLGFMRIYSNSGAEADYYQLCLFSAACLGIQSFMTVLLGVEGKKEIVAANLRDYLDNSLKVKMEQDYIYPELLRDFKEEKRREAVGAELPKEKEAEREDELQNIQELRHDRERRQPTSVRVPSRRRDDSAVQKELVQAVQSAAATRDQQIIDDILKEYLS